MILTAENFKASGATLVNLGSNGHCKRTYLAINDDVAGFQKDHDAIIRIGGSATISASDFIAPPLLTDAGNCGSCWAFV